MMMSEQLFKIEIDKRVDEIINWFANNYEQEISGWLVGGFEKDTIRITEILFPYQEVGGASVDTDAKALIKLRKEYGDKCLKIIGHFHSHNTMGNFWSGTDDEFISQYMEQRDKAIFLVSSKKNGHRLRLEVRNPISFTMDECDYDVVYDDELGEELQAIIDEKVTVVKPVVTVKGGYDYGYGGYGVYGGLQKGDEIIDMEDEEERANLSGLDDIDRMIDFNTKDNSVTIRGLSHIQYGQLEDLGKHTSRMDGGQWSMHFKMRKKKKAMKLIQEVRDFLESEKEGAEYDVTEDLV